MTKHLSRRVRHDTVDDVVRTLKHSAEDMSADAEKAVAEAAATLRDAMESFAASTVPQIKAEGREAVDAARGLAAKAGREAKEHPLIASVAALAAAAALIQLLSAARRKSV